MIAFVFSGGGNRGPLQIGALDALLQAGLKPDLVVGTSAGALNAVFLAAMGPTPTVSAALTQVWRKADKATVYPGGVFSLVGRLLSKADSLYPNDGMRRLIESGLPAGVRTFGDLQLPCYLTATDLQSSRLFLFGEDQGAPLVDAALASASVPGFHPPLTYQSLQLVDGGVVANVPASVAMDMGATSIYTVNVGYGGQPLGPATGFLNVLSRTLNTFMAQSLLDDLSRASSDDAVDLHHIAIGAMGNLPFNDFDHVDEMVVEGRKAAEAYLANPQPRRTPPALEPPGSTPRASAQHAVVGGAREYRPRYRR